ncbi:MAG: SDR family oxidoreductase [Thermogutta sp.]
MANCLVTGGAGFIGSHIVEALVERGHKVRVLDNLSTGYLKNLKNVQDQIDFVEGDILDADLVAKLIQGVDWVFHQAALASVPRSVEHPLETHGACATGTLILLDAARKAQVQRFIYAGSSSAYGDQPFAAKRESDLPDPISPYGAAKLAGEVYCRAFYATYGLPTVVIRYFNVFGPRQDPDSPYSAVIPLFITAILKGRRPIVYGDGHQSRDFTYVANVVHANLLAAEKDGIAGRVFNAAGGRSITLLQLLAALNEVLGTNVQPEFAPPRPGDIRESMADITAARKWLGYEPQIDFLEGLRRSVDYYREICG